MAGRRPVARHDGHHGVLRGLSGVKDPGVLLEFMVSMTKGNVRGHWKCPCGSGAIIRKCHKDAVRALQELPKEIIAQSGMMILDVLKARGSAGRWPRGSLGSREAPSQVALDRP